MKKPDPKTNRPTAIQSTPVNASIAAKKEPRQIRAIAKLREFTKHRESLPKDHLIFSEEAMDQLLWFRDNGSVEVGAFCQTSPEDVLYVEKLHFIKQECTAASTEFDEDAQHNLLVDMDEAGVQPENFMRIWVHTHPGSSATPSGTDWETFDEVFGPMPWSVMAIMAKSKANEMYCLFRHGTEAIHIQVAVDKKLPDRSEWENLYDSNILEPAANGVTQWSGGGWSTQNQGASKGDSWTEGVRPGFGLIGQIETIKLQPPACKKDQEVYRDFFGIGYMGVVPVPGTSWWDNNFLSVSCEEIWKTANKLIVPNGFAEAMERSFLTYLGVEEPDKTLGIFDPDVEQDDKLWPLHSPLAGLAFLRSKHPKKVESYGPCFKAIGKLPYKPSKTFFWTKGSTGKMTHCVRMEKNDQVIQKGVDEGDHMPLLCSIAASLRNEWPVIDCTQPAGCDMWQEMAENESIREELEAELYAQNQSMLLPE